MSWTNRRAMATRDRRATEATRFTDVWFREALKDPLRQVERIYNSIGVELTPEARASMDTWLSDDAREPRPAHSYAAEQFGLTDEEIRTEFEEYIARFVAPHEGASR